MGLPVLSLPQLVQQEIVRQWLPSELVCFSLCSRKSYNAVRALRNKRIKWEFVMSAGAHGLLSFWFDNGNIISTLLGVFPISEAPENCQKLTIKGHSVPCSSHRVRFHYLSTFWDDEVHGMKIVTDYCSELFDNMDVHTLFLDDSSLLWSLNWVMSRQETPLENIELRANTRVIGEQEFDQFLRDVKVTNELSMCWSPPPDFAYSGRLPRCQNFNISTGSWLTIDNLLTMDSVVVLIFESRFLSPQINRFLRAWLDGQCAPRLKFCAVEMTGVSVANEILEGIRERAVLADGKHTFYWSKYGYVPIQGGYRLERDDGTIVSFTQLYDHFFICSWPDMCGNPY